MEEIIFVSEAMRRVIDAAKKVAGSDIPVIIIGETGVGKEVIAKLIHANSLRKDKKFIAMNVAGIPESIFLSELCGHKKGSFTGASTERQGILRHNGGGTILFDEIGEMRSETQPILLRILEEKQLRPIGSDIMEPFDIRIIAASNCNFQKKIKDGSFRADLFYRLNRFCIEIPPLRDRKEDILPLAKHFLGMADHGDIVIPEVTVDLLLNHDWPGNVRELQSAIESALIYAGKEARELLPEHFVLWNKELLIPGQDEEPEFPLLDFPERTGRLINRAYSSIYNGGNIDVGEIVKRVRSYFIGESFRNVDSFEKAPEKLGLPKETFIAELNKLIRGGVRVKKTAPVKKKKEAEARVTDVAIASTVEKNEEKERIMEALKESKGNRKVAVILLGITYDQLRKRIKKHKLEEFTSSCKQKPKKGKR